MDVNRAIQQAKHRRRYQRPAGLDSLEPPLPVLDMTGELTLETTKILAEQLRNYFCLFNVTSLPLIGLISD